MGQQKIRSIDSGKYVKVRRETAFEISRFLFELGNQFIKVNNASGSFDCFKYALDLDPKFYEAVHNLGTLYNLTGNREGAVRMFREALRMNPGNITAMTALAEVSRKIGSFKESEELLEQAIKAEPDNYLVICAKAILEYDLGNLTKAMELNELALAKKPDDVPMLLNQALINMTFGRWAEYWPQYERVLSYMKNKRMAELTYEKAWDGRHVGSGILLVVSDQGFGDCLQFAPFVNEAKRKGGFDEVIYLIQPELVELMRESGVADKVIGFGEVDELPYTHYSSLLGVMRVLQVTPDTCYRDPYVRVNDHLTMEFREKIADYRKFKVGLVWQGDRTHGNDGARSIPLSTFAFLLDVPGVDYYSFQVNKEEQDKLAVVAPNVPDWGAEFKDVRKNLEDVAKIYTEKLTMDQIAGFDD
jgi:tetratricopeptide (TPR) repeat protein